MRFSQKIVAASSALLFIVILLLSIQQLSTVRSQITSLIDSSMGEMIAGVNSTIVSEMSNRKALAKVVAENLELFPEDNEFHKRLIEKPTIKQDFIAVGVGYEADGHFIENSDEWDAEEGFDPRPRPWYTQAKQTGKQIVTDPYVADSHRNVIISIGNPIYSDRQLVGVAFFDMQLNKLAELVNSVNLLNAGYLFIVTKDGTTIAHPDNQYHGQKFTQYVPNTVLKDGLQYINMEGKEYIVSFNKVSGEDWYIGSVVDEEVLFSAVTKVRNNAIIFAILGIVISIIGLTFLINTLLRPLRTLNNAIQDVASGEGDLTKRLDTNTDKEFAELAQGFNEFSATLQQQIIQSKAIGQEILRGAEQTQQGVLQSTDAIHTQLQELEQLATAMHEMSMTAGEVASNAQGAASAAKEADEAASEGALVVSDTAHSIEQLANHLNVAVAEVKQLELATANIETVLKVINDIADQTNLLALNAAIEAARAGDSGRGFAVVADEVRTLAQRTQQSTTEIRTMIEQLQAGAGSVSLAMDESKQTAEVAVEKSQAADSALQRIRRSIQQINDMNIQIASAAEEQSLVSEEINTNTVKIKDLSTQVAESAQQANIAMQVQTENVRDQDAILSKFIV